eukprot:9249071-Pyramimonas_sp.AAC.1
MLPTRQPGRQEARSFRVNLADHDLSSLRQVARREGQLALGDTRRGGPAARSRRSCAWVDLGDAPTPLTNCPS